MRDVNKKIVLNTHSCSLCFENEAISPQLLPFHPTLDSPWSGVQQICLTKPLSSELDVQEQHTKGHGESPPKSLRKLSHN